MSCGVPVIVSDLPFQAEFVQESDAGMVVPAGDADGLAKAVHALSTDEALRARLGRNGANVVARTASGFARAATIGALLRSEIEGVAPPRANRSRVSRL